MDRNQAKEFYPIMQAFAEGKVIECRTKPSALEDEKVPNEWAEIKVIEFIGRCTKLYKDVESSDWCSGTFFIKNK